MSRSNISGNGPRVRRAEHAGSWYSGDSKTLQSELQGYWDDAASSLDESEKLGIKHARMIISPHAGYSYSGPTAGVAFRTLDIHPGIRNVFVLGPSHHVYLTKAAISTCNQLDTPLGKLDVNNGICAELAGNSNLFTTVSQADEEAEHSLEMQYPFLKFSLDRVFTGASDSPIPTVVPIMIGNTSPMMEKQLGEVLAPYLKDPTNLFVISSDFAHWGKRFRYTYYLPENASDPDKGFNLKNNKQVPENDHIHESIARVDDLSIKAIKSGTHELFLRIIEQTNNTVCGRHPIGVAMAALQVLHKQFAVSENLSRFVFTNYTRSGLVDDVNDSSVSYASAYAKVECMQVLHLIKHCHSRFTNKQTGIDGDQWHRNRSDSSAGSLDLSSAAESAATALDVDEQPPVRRESPVPLRTFGQMFCGSFGEFMEASRRGGHHAYYQPQHFRVTNRNQTGIPDGNTRHDGHGAEGGYRRGNQNSVSTRLTPSEGNGPSLRDDDSRAGSTDMQFGGRQSTRGRASHRGRGRAVFGI